MRQNIAARRNQQERAREVESVSSNDTNSVFNRSETQTGIQSMILDNTSNFRNYEDSAAIPTHRGKRQKAVPKNSKRKDDQEERDE
jgi:hypothetical protein